MADVRAGFDVTEAMWIKEATFGGISQSGTWQFFGDVIGFDGKRRPVYKPRVGIGRQYPKELSLQKEYAELLVEAELLKKDVTVGEEYEWLNPYAAIWGADAVAATVNLEKHCFSTVVGAKLDLTTDEYLTFVGCKPNEITLKVDLENPMKLLYSLVSQKKTHGTVDYVQGTADRKTFPTESYIRLADCDVEYNSASIIERLQALEFTMRREINKRGSKTGAGTLFAKFSEVGLSMEVSLTLDFDSTNELTDFLGDTTRDIEIHVPTGSGGRQINLPTCQWKEFPAPIREVDLIELKITAEVLGVPTITTIP